MEIELISLEANYKTFDVGFGSQAFDQFDGLPFLAAYTERLGRMKKGGEAGASRRSGFASAERRSVPQVRSRFDSRRIVT